jgi:translocator protein
MLCPVISGFVFVQAFRRKVPSKVVLPFAFILVANLLFMPIFAGLRNAPRRWRTS